MPKNRLQFLLFMNTLWTKTIRVFFAVLSSVAVTPVIFNTRVHTRLRAGLRRGLIAAAAILLVASIASQVSQPAVVTAATSSNLNFQARLELANGSIAPDGNYNIEFKLYNAATAGTALWTESHLNNVGQGLRVVNGYVTVNLGSVTPFPSTIAWDQELYITMNVGGTSTGVPTYDGEMSPRLKLTSVPYAFQANSARQLQAVVAGNTGTLSFAPLTASRAIELPDAAGTVCLQFSTDCGFASNAGSNSYIQNSVTLQTNANFNFQSSSATAISGAIRALTGQTADLFRFSDAAGTTLSGVNANGRFYNQSGAFTGTLVQGPLAANTQYNLIDPGVASVDFCLSTGNCAGAGSGVTSAAGGTVNYLAKFSDTRDITSSMLFDNGSFVGVNTTVNNGLLSVVSTNAAQSGLYVGAATSATSPAFVVQGGATPGVGGDLINLKNSAGVLLSGFDANGNLFFRNGFNGTLAQSPLAQNTTYRLTDPAQGIVDICLSTGNCAGAGSGVTSLGGTVNRIAKFNAARDISDSMLYDDGTFVGLNTTTNSGLLSLVGLTATQSTIFAQGAGSATSPVAVVRSGATPGLGADLLQLQNATGAIVAKVDATGNLTAVNGLFSGDVSQTGTGTLSTGTGAVSLNGNTSVTGANTLTVGTGATSLGGTLTVTGPATFNGGLTAVGSTLINTTGTAGTAIGTDSGTFSLSSTGLDVSAAGALSGITGYTQTSGNFAQSGTGTFSTGSGNVTLNGATTATGALTVQGAAGLTLGISANTAGVLNIANSTNSNLSVIRATAPSGVGNATFNLPSLPAGTITDFCLSTGNCAGAGNSVTSEAGGTINYLAKFTNIRDIGNSSIYNDGSFVGVNTTTNSGLLSLVGTGSSQSTLFAQGAASAIVPAAIIRSGATPGAGADLLQLQNSTGGVVAKFDSAGNLTAVGATFSGNVSQTGGGTFSTGSGAVSLNGNTSITGANTFAVGTGASTFGGTLSVTGATTLGSTLLVSGASTFSNNVEITGAGTFTVGTGATSLGGTLAVTGATNISSSLTVNGGITNTGSYTQTGTGTFSTGTGTVSLNGATTVSSTLAVQGAGGLTVGVAGTTNGRISYANNVNTNLAILEFGAPSGIGGNATYTVPSIAGGTSDTFCLRTANNCDVVTSTSEVFIRNQTTQQTNGNFNILARASTVAAVIQGASGQDIIRLANSLGATVASVDANGNLTAVGANFSGNVSQTGATTFSTGTGTVSLNGVTSVTGANTFTVGTGATTLGGTLGVTGLTTLNGGATITGATSVTGAATINTSGTANTAIGNATGTFTLESAGLDVTAAGALSGITTINMSGAISAATTVNTINGLIINGGALSGITGYSQTSGNFSQTGTGTFSTGTGAVTLNGNTSIAGTSTLTVGTGATTLGGTLGVTGLTTLSGGLSVTGATNINTSGTAATTIGNATAAFSLSSTGLNVSAAGALSGITGYDQISGNFAIAGAGTFSTGTGAVSLNGNTSITGTNTLSVGTGATTLGGTLTVAGGTSLNGGATISNGATIGGGATITGATNINTTGLANTAIGNATGTFTLQSAGLDVSAAGALSGITGYDQISGNFAIAGAGTFSTGTGAVSLNGSTSITGTNTLTVGTGATSLGGTLAVTGLTTLSGGLTATGTTNVNTTGLSSTAIGNATGSFTLDSSGLDVSAAGALSGITTINMSGAISAATTVNTINGLIINGGALSGVTSYSQTSGNFSQTGAGTFSTGTGAVTLNGATSVAGANTFNVGTGATTLGGTLAVTGASTLTGLLTANGGINMSGNFVQSGTGTFSTGSGAVSLNGATTISSTLAVQGVGGVTVGVAGVTAGSVSFANATNTNLGTIQIAAPSGIGNATYTVPSIAGGASDTFCLQTANNCDLVTSNSEIFIRNQTTQQTSGNFNIQARATTVAAVIQGAAGQDIIRLVNSAGAIVASVDGSGNLTAVGANFSGNVSQTGATTFSTGTGTVSLNGATSVTGTNTLTVGTGATSLGGTLSVAGATTFNGGVSISGTNTLTVGTGAVSFGGTLAVTGTSTFTGAATFNGGITDTGNFSQTGIGTFSTGTGAVSLNGATSVTGTNTLTVGTGATSLGGTLDVAGLSSLNGGTTITGITNINTVGTANTAIGNSTGTFTLQSAGLDVDSTGALSGITTINMSGAISAATTVNTINGLIINGGSLSGITGYNQASGNFAIAGAGTFSTGTGNITLNGATTANSTLAVRGAGGVTIGVGGLGGTTGSLNLANTTNTNLTTIQAAAPTGTGNATITVPSITGGSSDTFCLRTANNCDVVTSTSEVFVRNQTTQQTNGNFNIQARATTVAAVIQGASGQDIIRLVNSLGATVASVDGSGNLTAVAGNFSGNISQTGATTLSTGTGGVTLNGNTSISGTNTLTVGTGATSLGGTLTVTGATTLNGTLAVGGTSTFTGAATFNGGIANTGNYNQTGTGTFSTGAGAVSLNGATSVTGTNTFTVGTGATSLGGTLGVTGLATLNGGATINGTTSVTGSTTINTTGTAATTIGNIGAAFSLASTGLNVTNAGALSGITTINMSGAISAATTVNTINGLIINGGSLSGITGYNQASGNFAIAGAGTFSTGTGAVTLNGNTSISGANTLTVGTGATSLGGTLGVTGATTLTGLLTANGGITMGSNFVQSGTGTFSTGTGTVSLNGATTVSSTLAVQGTGGVTIGVGGLGGTTGSLNLANTTNTNMVTIQGAAPSGIGNATITVPSIAGGTSDTFCLRTANNCDVVTSTSEIFIRNQTTQQTSGNFNIQARATTVAAVIQGASGQDIIRLVNSTGATVASVDGSGNLTAVGGNFSGNIAQTGATTFSTGTGTISLNGATSVTGANTLTVGTGATSLGGTLGVTGATTLNSTLAVTGASTFTGAATFNGGITDTGNFSQTGVGTFSTGTGTVSLNGATSVTGTNTLTVGTGATSLGGTLGVTGATSLSSTLAVTGASTFNGNVSVAGASTFTTGTGVVTLGSLSTGIVQSSATGVLSSGTVDRNSTFFTGTLTVPNGGTGATTFGTNGILYGNGTGAILATASAADSVLVTGIGSVPTLSQQLPLAVQGNITRTGILTAGSIAAGFGTINTNNAITTSATVQGGTITSTGAVNGQTLNIGTITAPATTAPFTVNATGAITAATGITTTGNFSQTGTGTFSTGTGAISLNGNTSVTGANTFTVGTGATSLGGTLTSTGLATLNGGLNVLGATTINTSGTANTTIGNTLAAFSLQSTGFSVTSTGALSGITGYDQASGNFAQSGTGTFGTGTGAVSLNGATTVGSTLAVTGATTLSGTLTANDASTFNANVSVAGTNTLTVGTGATSLGGTLTVTGATTLNSTLAVTGTTTLTGLLTANGGITTSGNFSQTGATTFSTGTGAVSLNGATTVSSTLAVQGAGGVTIGIAGLGGTTGSINLANTINTNLVSIQAAAPTGTGNAIITVPSITGGSSDTFCLRTANNCDQVTSDSGTFIRNQTTQQTAANFNIQASSATVAAVIQGASGQDIIRLVNSLGATVASVDGTGNLTAVAANFSGNITQTGATTFSTGTGTVTLNGNTSISGANTLTVGTGATSFGGTLTVTGLATLNGGATVSGTTSITGATTINTTGTAATSIGNTGAAFSLASNGLNVTSTGALSGIAGYAQASGNFAQAGIGTFSTGTGTVSLNGATSVTGTNTFNVGTGASTLGGTLTVEGLSTFNSLATFNAGATIATGSTFTNASSTLLSTVSVTGPVTGGPIGTAAATVDVATTFTVNQTSANQTLSLPAPTNTAAGRLVYVISSGGSVDFTMHGTTIKPSTSASFVWNGTAWVNPALSASGVTTVGAIDSQTKSANGAVINGTSIYLQTADATNVGLVTAAAQTIGGAKTFNSLLTAGAGLTTNNGAVTLNGNAASSFTTSAGALTLTSAAAATWSTASGNLTLQAGSGTVSLGTSTTLTANGALSLVSGGATTMSIDAGGAASLNLGATNANAVSISRTGVATTINGSLTVTQASTFNGNVSVAGAATLTVGTGATSLGGTLGVTGAATLSSTLNVRGAGGVTLGVSGLGGTSGVLQFANTTNTNLSILNAIAPSGTGNATYSLPTLTGGSAAEICLDTGNCAGAGGSITGSGTTNYVARFDSNSTINASSLLYDDTTFIGVGTTVSSATLSVLGAAATKTAFMAQATASATTPVAVLKGGATPGVGGDLLQLQNSAGAVLAKVDAAGNLTAVNGSFSGDLAVTGASSLGGTLTVTGLATLNGGATVNGATSITGATTINTTGTAATTIGNSTAAFSLASTGLNVTSAGALSGITGYSQASGNFAITGTGTFSTGTGTISLNGATSITGTNTLNVGTGATTLGGTLTVTGLTTLNSGLSAIGATNINTTGTASTTIGNATGSFSVASAGLNVTAAGALNGITTINMSGAISAATTVNTINGLIINGGSLSGITGYDQASGNFAQSGTGTFATGTGAVSLNGATTVSSTLAVRGAGGITVGVSGLGGTTGTINLANTTNANLTSIQSLAPSGTGNAILNFPSVAGGSTDEICLKASGNCAGSGGGVTTSGGTLNYITKFSNSGATEIKNSSLYDDGTFVGVNTITNSGAFSVQGTSATQPTIFAQATTSATTPVAVIKGGATPGLGADLMQFQNSLGTVLAKVDASGNITSVNSTVTGSFSQTGAGTFSTGTGTVTLNGATSVSGTNTFTVGTGATNLGGALTVAGLTTLNGGATVNGTTSITGATTINTTGTAATTIGNTGAAFSLASTGLNVSTTGAITGATTITASGAITAATTGNTINGLIINGGAISGITGYSQASGNFSQTGAGTFGTGTGAVSLNGATSVTGANTLTVGTGATSLGGTLTVTGASTFNGSVSISGANTLTTGTGAVTFGSLGAGLVQSSVGGVLSSGAVDRNSATFFSGTLNVANGGTGAATLAANGILYGNGTGAIQATAAAANSILATDGTSVPALTQTLPSAVQNNITATGALASGSITTGFGSISTGSTIATSGSLQGGTLSIGTIVAPATTAPFTVDATGAITAATGITTSGNFLQTGTGTFGTGSGAVSLNGATTVSSTLNVQGAGGLTLGVAGVGGTAGSLRFANTTNTNLTILNALAASGTGNAAVNIPTVAGGSTDELCLKALGNCAGAGNGVTAVGGTQNYISKFTNAGGTEIGSSSLYNDGNFVGVGTTTNSGFVSIAGSSATQVTLFAQAAASATTPVAVIKGGATPGLGADLLQLQNSLGTIVAKIDATGNLSAVDAIISGNFSQTGTGTFSTGTGAVNLNGATTAGSTLAVTGATTLTGTLTANSASTFNGNVGVSGSNSLTVNSGATSLGGTLTVTGASTFNGSVSISGVNTLTTGTGTVTLGSLGAGLVQSSSSGVLSSGAVDRNSTTYFSGTLNVANGGTGATTFASNGILYGNGTGAIQATAAAAESVLVTLGTSTPSLSQTLPSAVQGNITRTGALAAGSIVTGFGTITTANNITTSAIVQGGTVTSTGAVNGQTLNIGTITAPATTAPFTVNASGAVTAATGITTSGNFSQTGAGTFSTGTGAVSLNGATSVTGTNTFNVGTGISTFGGAVNVQSASGLTLGVAGIGGTTGTLQFANTTNTNLGVLQIAAPSGTGNATITFPSIAGGSSDTVCLKLAGNCAGSLSATGGQANYVARFTSSTDLGIGILYDNGSFAGVNTTTNNGTLSIQSSGATTAAVFAQGAASATSPVAVIRGGATPGIGGDLLQLQNSLGTVVAKIDATGNLSAVDANISGNFAQSGAGTFNTGTGAVNLNGATTAGSTLAVTGATTLTGTLTANGASTFNNSVSISGTNTLTTGTGAVTFGSLGAGLVQSNASGLLSSGVVDRNSASFFNGTLNVGNGGTGATTLATNGILFGNGTGAIQATSALADAVLTTGATGIPALSQTLPLAVQGNITRTGVLNAGSITTGFGAISTGNTIATTGALQGGTLSVGAGAFAVNATGAITAATGIATTGNFAQSGAGTFSTGTGAVNLNGATTIAGNTSITGTSTLTVGTGTATFGGAVNVQGGGGLTLGVAGVGGTTGTLRFANTTNTNLGVLQFAAPSGTGNATYTVPSVAGGTTDTFCLQTVNNCGGVSASGGQANYVARFTGTSTLGIGVLYDNGSFAGVNTTTNSGTLSVLSSGATSAAIFAQGAASATTPVAVIKGGATPGIGGDLLQLQNSTGTVVAKVDASGSLTAGSVDISGNFTQSGAGSFSTGTGAVNLNGATTIAGNTSITGTSTLTVGTGAVTLGSLGAGLVQSNASGLLSSGTADRNSATFFSGTLNVANGGTGVTTLTSNGILYGNGTGTVQATTSLANAILRTGGTGIPELSQTLPQAVQGNITNVGVLTAGSITTGFGTISTGNNITTTAVVQGGTITSTGALNGQTLSIGTITAPATTAPFTVNATGAITAATGITTTGNFSQTGAGTFSTGTGNVFLNGPSTVSSTLAVQGAGGLTLGVAGVGGTTGALNFANTTNTNLGILQIAAPSGVGNATYTVPSIAGGTSDTFCLQTVNNCGGVSASGGQANYVARFTGTSTLGIGILYDNGSFAGVNTTTNNGTLSIQSSGAAQAAVFAQGAASATAPVAVIKGGATPTATADLLQLQNSAGTVLAKVDNAGNIMGAGFDTPAAATLNIGMTNATSIALRKNTAVTGSLSVSNGLTVSAGASSFAGNVDITGATSTLTVGTGATSLGGTLAVTGTSTFTGLATFNGGVTVANNSNLTQTGTGSFSTGTGAVNLNGATTIGSTLNVSGGTVTVGSTGQFTISTSGNVATSGSVLGSSFDSNAAAALNIGTTNATSIGLMKNTTVTGTLAFSVLGVSDTSATLCRNSLNQLANCQVNFALETDTTNFVRNQTTQQINTNFNIQARTASVAAVIQGAASNDIIRLVNSVGSTVASIDANGNLTAVGGTFSGAVNANGGVFLGANQNLSLAAGTGTITQSYSNTTGSADTRTVNNSGISGINVVNGITVNPTGAGNTTGTNTTNAINLGNVAAATNNAFYAFKVGTGYTDILNYNGTSVINGLGQFNLAQAFGTLGVANGGTGANSLTTNGILYGNGTSAVQTTAAAANSILATNGTNVPALTQTLPAAVQGNITSVGTLTGGSITSFGSITTANNISTTATVQGSIVNATTGFQINGAAPAGQFLRGNGTNFVASTIAGTDISGTLFTVAASAGTPQNVSGGGTVTFLKGSSNNLTTTASATNNITIDIVANPTFTGLVTSTANTTGASLTGAPTPGSGSSSLLQLGGAIASGNVAVDGGTYVGINAPLAGAGSAADFLNFQSNGAVRLRVNNAGQLNAAGGFAVGANTGSTVTCGAGQSVTANVFTGGILTGGTCSQTVTTLQIAYDASGAANPQILLNGTNGGLKIQDGATAVTGNLLQIANNGGTTNYFAVSSSAVNIVNALNVNGAYTQTGTGANTFTGGSTFSATGTAVRINNGTLAVGVASEFQVNNAGLVTINAVGTADSVSYLCRNSTNQLATCGTSGTGAAFTQGGNDFGADAILGTNGVGQNLTFKTANTNKLQLNAAGSLTFLQNSTVDTAASVTNGSIGFGTTNAQTINIGNAGAAVVTNFTAGAYGMRINNSGVNITSSTNTGSDLTLGDATNIVGRTIKVVQAASGAGADLTIQAGSAGTGTFNGGNLVLQAGAKGTTGTAAGTVIVRANGTDGTAFQVQKSDSTALLSANTTTMTLSIGTGAQTFTGSGTGDLFVSGSAGLRGMVLIGTTANGNTFDGTTGELTLSGTARHAISVSLTPEYPGATMTADGTSNVGTMTTDFCSGSLRLNIPATANPCAASEEQNYYSWTSQTANNDYDIFVRYRLPSDFSGFDTAAPIQMLGWVSNAGVTPDTVTLSMYNAGTLCGTANVATATGTWTLTALGGYDGTNYGTCTLSANSIVTFRVQLNVATAGNFARAGDIQINYRSKY